MMVSCKPTLIKGPSAPANVEKSVLDGAFTFQQFEDELCTIPSNAGNFLKYNCSAGVVQVFKEGAEDAAITTGAGGVVKIPVKRGQEPTANLVFALTNFDGSVTKTTKSFTVTPPTALTPEMLIAVSDNGKKVWKWSNVNTFWGNAGNSGNGAGFVNGNIDGKWWGPDSPAGLLDQTQHSGDGKTAMEASWGAFMVLDEDGIASSYSEAGELIRTGKFEIKGYNGGERVNNWEQAKLITPEPALLFPWGINEKGKAVTEFNVMEFTPQLMTLVDQKNAVGSWQEITFWQFVAATPEPLTLEGKWGWSTSATCWGNAGNSGSGASFNAPGVVDGKWWGVTSPEELAGQSDHSGDGKTEMDASTDAYMMFEGNTVTSYAADGTKIRGGEYEVVMNDFVSGAGRGAKGWELGKLTTSEPALLFPWSINEHGVAAPEFDIMYFDANNMTLVYTKGNGSGSWKEITFWCFERRK